MTNFLHLSFSLLCTLGVGGPTVLGASPLAVGAEAPQFEAKDIDGKTQNLHTLLEEGPVVLVFFPAASSPICSKELQSFVAEAAQLQSHGATVLALSSSKEANMRTFRDDLKANFAFITDGKGLIANRYRAKMPVIPQTSRRTYIVGQDGKIAFAQADQDAAEMVGLLDALAALPKR